MSAADELRKLELDEKAFVGLLETLIGFAGKLQNNPPDRVPQEELATDAVIAFLEPYSGDKGPLRVEKHMYVEGRSNLIVRYDAAAKTDRVVSFVGMHQDVVPANPEEWERDPFKLTVDGDKLYGRGVTDCLGHVALVAELLRQIAIKKPKLSQNLVAVFIANEEASDAQGVGVDELERKGELESLKNGPLYWIDSANFGPTLATGGVVGWKLTFKGKKFHSGVPHQAINPIELASEAVRHFQSRFYEEFTKHAEEEKRYKFNVGSSMKPTQISAPPGSLNQIPGECTVSGDIRFTPFYAPAAITEALERYVRELDVTTLPCFGASRFELPADGLKGTVELTWLGEPYPGVACDIDSVGHKALLTAVDSVRGAEPFSLTGSLPLIADLKDAGYDVQVTGFGKMEAYHANNEFAYVGDYRDGLRILANTIANLEQ